MNEPWISPGILGGILGGTFGTLGALVGTLSGYFVPKGKAKKLVLGAEIFTVSLLFISLVIGIVAYMSGQPRGVWWGFIYTGCLGLLIFGSVILLTLKLYRHVELRKLMAEDLTFGGDKDDQQKQEESTEPSEPLPAAKAQEVPKSVLLKEIFLNLDHLLSKSKEFKKNLKRATPKNFTEFNARGKALEDEVQSYCRRIAKEFPGAVIFITFQGQEWAYDVDFQMIKNSLEEPVPAELEGYFRYASLRKMFRLRKIPSKQLQQMQPTRR